MGKNPHLSIFFLTLLIELNSIYLFIFFFFYNLIVALINQSIVFTTKNEILNNGALPVSAFIVAIKAKVDTK